MTVYFVSSTPAALRLDGKYVGIIDSFARRTELCVPLRAFAEAAPSDNRQPVNFMLDGAFLSSPPDFASVCLMGGDALVRIRKYLSKDSAPSVIWQTRFAGNLVTLCRMGSVMLCSENSSAGGANICRMDESYALSSPEEGTVGTSPVLFISAARRLAVLSEGGKVVFDNPATSFSQGDMLRVTVPFRTCTGAAFECAYSYDGEAFTLASGRTAERILAGEEIRHFAFFESVLTRADPASYLSPGLRERAGELSSYLGQFVDVIIPPQKLYEKTGEERAAGLVYPAAKNAYIVKFYAADMREGLVENIREVEY